MAASASQLHCRRRTRRRHVRRQRRTGRPGLTSDGHVARRQRVAGIGGRQLGHGADIAGRRPRSSGICSLPRRVKRAWRRSSALDLGLNRTASGRTVPDTTLNSDIFPT